MSKDGDDGNPGTKEKPVQTLETAVTKLGPGDTLFIRGGLYYRGGSINVRGLTGTPDERIVIAGHPNERPIFIFKGPVPGGWEYEGGLRFSNVNHVSIRNLTLRNSAHTGIEITDNSANNSLMRVHSVNNNKAGIAIRNSSSDNLLQNIVAGNTHDPQNKGEDGDGLIVRDSSRNTIRSGRFYFNSDDGLDLWNSSETTISRCVSWNNGRNESGDGNGFKLGGDETVGDHRVTRNIAFNNRATGFDYNNAQIPIELFNNTAWNNSYNYFFTSAEHSVANNISHSGRVKMGGQVRDRHNTWNLDIDDPGFKSYFPNGGNFLHLSEESPCIDRGVELDGLKFVGQSPDLGAYELGMSQ